VGIDCGPRDRPTKGNLIVRYRGKHPGKTGAFPRAISMWWRQSERDWSVESVRVHGEGRLLLRDAATFDMKDGRCCASAESLIRLKTGAIRTGARHHRSLHRRTKEAGGDSNGPAFLLKEHRDLIDAGISAINLDGGGRENLKKRCAVSISRFGTSEKDLCPRYTLEDHQPRGTRFAGPGPDNAILPALPTPLNRLEAYQVPGDADRDGRVPALERSATVDPGSGKRRHESSRRPRSRTWAAAERFEPKTCD